MPIYEYWCEVCKKTSSFLLLRATEEVAPYCKVCGGKDVKRRISRVALPRGEERMMERLLNPSRFSDLDENNPSSIERAVRRMGKELGEELGGDFEESMGEALGSVANPEDGL
ncbi:MAG: zinc ribbon domain-containing protein [Proteobacteria bacterium]|nr:zinc ribbon domain-containing protein [Pseudomonadota bacterium]